MKTETKMAVNFPKLTLILTNNLTVDVSVAKSADTAGLDISTTNPTIGVTYLTLPGMDAPVKFAFFKEEGDGDLILKMNNGIHTATRTVDMNSQASRIAVEASLGETLNKWLTKVDLSSMRQTDHGVARVSKARNSEGGNMMMFTIQERAHNKVVAEDVGLSLAGLLEMTDFDEGEVDSVARLGVGESIYLGEAYTSEEFEDRIRVIRTL